MNGALYAQKKEKQKCILLFITIYTLTVKNKLTCQSILSTFNTEKHL